MCIMIAVPLLLFFSKPNLHLYLDLLLQVHVHVHVHVLLQRQKPLQNPLVGLAANVVSCEVPDIAHTGKYRKQLSANPC